MAARDDYRHRRVIWALTAPHIAKSERLDPPVVPDVLQLDEPTEDDDEQDEQEQNGAIPWQVSQTSE